jgi:hypothetical protein
MSCERIFYVACKIFQIRNCIYEEYGAVQLNNLEAEDIVYLFGKEFALKFEVKDTYKMHTRIKAKR